MVFPRPSHLTPRSSPKSPRKPSPASTSTSTPPPPTSSPPTSSPPPSYFETLTALAFLYFAEQQLDIAVLEVGLGGRLDATNIVEPLLSVITDIALDHQEYLGSTLAEIAREKAGILRPNGTLITLPQHPEANRAIGEAAVALNVRAISATPYLPNVERSPSSVGRPNPPHRFQRTTYNVQRTTRITPPSPSTTTPSTSTTNPSTSVPPSPANTSAATSPSPSPPPSNCGAFSVLRSLLIVPGPRTHRLQPQRTTVNGQRRPYTGQRPTTTTATHHHLRH